MLKLVSVVLLGVVLAVSALAAPADDKALQDAALALDINSVKAALQHGGNPNSASKTPRPLTPLGNLMLGMRVYRDEIKDSNDRAVEIAKRLFAAGAKLSAHIGTSCSFQFPRETSRLSPC
jgi:hypothetical protein